MSKRFSFLPPHSRARPILPPQQPANSPSPFLPCAAQAVQPSCRRARVPSLPQRLTAWPHSPRHCQVGPRGQNRLPPRVRAGYEPSATTARVSREQSPLRPTLLLYILAPPPAIPKLNPSVSHHVKAHQSRRRDPRRSQSAAAAPSSPRERLAELRIRLAKSPQLSLLVFVLRTRR